MTIFNSYKKAFCFNPPPPGLGGEKVFFVISKIAHNARNLLYIKKEKTTSFIRNLSFSGDPAEIRTPDTLLKRQVLCRLSYWIKA